ncbi:tail fiber assembly protein [Yersinia bercovieri]|uniref:tail fiber assembly protein n=1 Tax=Yersinia bercovieri TaxID=634 RepID=UPI0011A23231|nr:tail fiber assembly protein [Yersinia bercovieri]
MSNIYFSASTAGFYDGKLINDGSYDGSLPSDIIELTPAENEAYKGVNPPDGKMLGAIDGRPAWVDLPLPTHEELVARANAKKSQLKAIADSEIEWRQDAVDDGNTSDKEIAALAAWRKYRVALMRIDTSNPTNITWPPAP